MAVASIEFTISVSVKMNISILTSNRNHPVVTHIKNWIHKISYKGHDIKLFFDKTELTNGDILFLVSYNHIITDFEMQNFETVLVLHASDLPSGKGWSPYIWDILAGGKRITVSLVQAELPVDSGPIWAKQSFTLEGHELVNEINTKLFLTEIKLMSIAIDNYYSIEPKIQPKIHSEYFRKRTPEDSRLDPNKTIKEQFNLLRVADYHRYPAFFEHLGHKYKIKIEEYDDETFS